MKQSDIINHNDNVEESTNDANVDKNVNDQDIVANSDDKNSDVSKCDEEEENGSSSESSSGSESNVETQHSKKKIPSYNNVHRFPCTTTMTRNFSIPELNNPPSPKSTPPFNAWIDNPLLKVPKLSLFRKTPGNITTHQ